MPAVWQLGAWSQIMRTDCLLRTGRASPGTGSLSLRQFLATASLLPLVCSAPRAAAADFHVAVGGDDRAAGSVGSPFATLPRAQRAVRELRLRETRPGPLTVVLHGGTYELDAPLLFGPEDSGTAESPVTYASAPGERAVLSGGRRLPGPWLPVPGKPTWQTAVPRLDGQPWRFNSLTVNGLSRERARHPNWGQKVLRAEGRAPGEDERQAFTYLPGDIDPGWTNLTDVELVLLCSWTPTIHRLREVPPERRVVRFFSSHARAVDAWERNFRYYVASVFRNNLGAFARDGFFLRGGLNEHWPTNSCEVSRNLYLARDAVAVKQSWEPGLVPPVLRRNLYFSTTTGTDLTFAGRSFADWQAAGQDAGSLLADPGCRDPERYDFTLRADAAAPAAIGFVPFAAELAADTPARFDAEIRDGASPYRVGPSLQISRDGLITANTRPILQVRPGAWFHLAVEFRLGDGAPKEYTLTSRYEGRQDRLTIPFGHEAFAEIRWLGICAAGDADGAFYLDDLRFAIE